MESRIFGEKVLVDANLQLSNDLKISYFKLVGIGPNTIDVCQGNIIDVSEIVSQQSGFFIFGENHDELRISLHELVDKFCDKLEESKDESEK
jgi:hypothetical protein